MPRYIDADKVMEEIERIGGHNLCEWETIGVKALIDRQPTADVAPRSEVERLYYNLRAVLEERAETKREIARKIFEEIERLIKITAFADCWSEGGFKDDIAELKKKYTEGDDPK